MAHKNKKKPAAPAALKPEKYIQQKGRSLPVYECLINADWKEEGLASIAVCRQMPSGNLVVGVYLVDTYCLGLKQTMYFFNHPIDMWESDLRNMIYDEQDYEVCDYVLAHNIIYGGIAYAEDLQFKAHKDFRVTQFLLAEDTEEVELIEIEFGKNGKPYYVPSPEDNVDYIIGRLYMEAGDGHFEVDTEALSALREEDEWDEDWEDEAEEIHRAPIEIENTVVTFGFAAREGLAECMEALGEEALYELYGFIIENPAASVARLNTLIQKHPEQPLLFSLLYMVAVTIDDMNLAHDTAKQMYARFPASTDAFMHYATMSFEHDELDTVEKLLNGKYMLADHFPERKEFRYTEMISFWSVVGEYFIRKGDADQAKLYLDKIKQLDPESNLIEGLEEMLDELEH
jgi:hypothetical protein